MQILLSAPRRSQQERAVCAAVGSARGRQAHLGCWQCLALVEFRETHLSCKPTHRRCTNEQISISEGSTSCRVKKKIFSHRLKLNKYSSCLGKHSTLVALPRWWLQPWHNGHGFRCLAQHLPDFCLNTGGMEEVFPLHLGCLLSEDKAAFILIFNIKRSRGTSILSMP